MHDMVCPPVNDVSYIVRHINVYASQAHTCHVPFSPKNKLL